jgi:serine/threonine-protein kinase
MVGKVLKDRYTIVERIGVGNTGVVYRADSLKVNRQVAVKVYLRDFIATPSLRARFERVARSLTMLAHLNIAPVKDWGVEDEQPFLVVELLKGQSLQELIAAGPLPPRVVYGIAEQVLRALVFAHGQSCYHEDLTPANITLKPEADSLLAQVRDLGVARFVVSETVGPDAPVMVTSKPFGSPAYMAPERAAGGAPSPLGDLYSVGAIFFEMIAGRAVYRTGSRDDGDRPGEAPIPRLRERRPELNRAPELDAFIQHAMAKNPDDRFPDALEMLKALEPLREPLERAMQPPGRASSEPSTAPHPPTASEPPPRSEPAEAPGARPPPAGSIGHDPGAPPARPLRASDAPVAPPQRPMPTPDARVAPTARPLRASDAPVAPLSRREPAPDVLVAPTTRPAPEREENTSKPFGPAVLVDEAAAPAPQAAERRRGLKLGLVTALVICVIVSIPVAILIATQGDEPIRRRVELVVAGDPGPADLVPRHEKAPETPAQIEPAPTETKAPTKTEAPTETEASIAPVKIADTATDPWAGFEADPVLVEAKTQLESGEELSDGQIMNLRQHIREHEDDHRPWLLLARNRMGLGHLTDALDCYETAHKVNDVARQDPRMIDDLLRVAKSPTLGDRAARLVKRIYGREAIQPVREAMVGADLEDAGTKRLGHLLENLEEIRP